MWKWAFVVVLVACVSSTVRGQPAATTVCPAQIWNAGLIVPGGATGSTTHSTGCLANATSDLAARFNTTPQWVEPICYADTWGPYALVWPSTSIPSTCNRTQWFTNRVLAAIDMIVNEDFNYCHHHAPTWLPPDTATMRVLGSPNACLPSFNATETCSYGGRNNRCASRNNWQALFNSLQISSLYDARHSSTAASPTTARSTCLTLSELLPMPCPSARLT